MRSSSQPLSEFGARMERFQQAIEGSGALSRLGKQLEALGNAQEPMGRLGGVAAARLAATSQPLGEFGARMERFQQAIEGSGALSRLGKQLEALGNAQERMGRLGGVAAARLAATSQPLGEFGARMERFQQAIEGSGALSRLGKQLEALGNAQERMGRLGGVAATAAARLAAASQPLGELGPRMERLSLRPSVPPVPRLLEVPRVSVYGQLGSLAPRQPVRSETLQSELTKPYGNRQRNVPLEIMLATIEPAFAHQFRGALLCSEERGPDWFTHAAASFRKLLHGLLRTAVTDEQVLPWVRDSKAQLDRNGRPTRRTKIKWLCRSIQNKGYRRFVECELDSALEVLELCNQAVHVNEFPEFEESFSSVTARVEFAVLHIVRLSSGHRSN